MCLPVYFASSKSSVSLSISSATGCCDGFTECRFVNEAPSIYGAGGVVRARGTYHDADGFLSSVSAVMSMVCKTTAV